MSREGALWIGALEPYMDESFLRRALHLMGEDNIVSIKVMRNKMTGETANYGFINFENDYSALLAMHKLNQKFIPNTNPPVRFKLNHNSTRLMPGEKDHSIWVGDLTPEVDDFQFYKFFSARFQSVKSAKVVFDVHGISKGYGFVRFGNEQEQQTALATMMNAVGLGLKGIKVSSAVPKPKSGEHDSGHHAPPASGGPEADYSQYWQSYSQYWSQMAAYNTPSYFDPASYYNSKPAEKATTVPKVSKPEVGVAGTGSIFAGNSHDIVDHSVKLDYDALNQQHMRNSEELWTAIEASRWSSSNDESVAF